MTRIGVFGGTFDPPHLGHLILAADAVTQLNLDRLLWVLTPDPPHKLGLDIRPVEVRLQLVCAAIADNPQFELSRVDLDREGPHYTVDTLRLLKERYPSDDLIYLMGEDSLRDLPGWRDPEGFLANCTEIGVMRRPGTQVDLDALEKSLPGINARLRWIETLEIEISARGIRERIQHGQMYRYLVSPEVYRLMEAGGWYRSIQPIIPDSRGPFQS